MLTAEILVSSLLEDRKAFKRHPPPKPKPVEAPKVKPPVIFRGKAVKRNRTFDRMFDALPNSVQRLTKKVYALWRLDPGLPGLEFKKLTRGDGRFYSVRIGDHYRAICREYPEAWLWCWIDTHEAYNKFTDKLDSFPDPLFT